MIKVVFHADDFGQVVLRLTNSAAEVSGIQEINFSSNSLPVTFEGVSKYIFSRDDAPHQTVFESVSGSTNQSIDIIEYLLVILTVNSPVNFSLSRMVRT